MKKCNKCLTEQPISNFPVKNHGPGTKSYPAAKCKGCVNIHSRDRFQRKQAIRLASLPPKHIPEKGFKTCNKCKEDRPQNLQYFHKLVSSKDGLNSQCKECVNFGFKSKRAARAKPKYTPPPGMKRCNKCETEKTFLEFYKRSRNHDGLDYACKACLAPLEKAKRLRRIVKNIDKNKEIIKTPTIQNKAIPRNSQVLLKSNLKNTRAALDLELGRISKEEYAIRIEKIEKEAIEDSVKTRNRTIKRNNSKTDVLVSRLASKIRTRTSRILKRGSLTKSKHLVEYLGCTVPKFIKYLQRHWEPGMSWDNYGNGPEKWNLDHTIPFSSAKSAEDVYRLSHYTNVRPMWSELNTAKSNKSPSEWAAYKLANNIP